MSGHRRTLRRIEHPGHGRYLTFSCYKRLTLFSNDKLKDAFVENLAAAKASLGFELYAWVVMPEHVHLLIRTGSYDLAMKTVLHRIKSPFSRAVFRRWRELKAPILSRVTTGTGRTCFWQAGGGYDRNIHTDHELFEKVEYIHDNPVRRGLVKRQVDYRWSSARWYEGDRFRGPEIDPFE